MKILYLTPGCFDKGGISRYSRYQITALRELIGPKNIYIHSLLGPGEDSFEEPFNVTHYAGGISKSNKLNYLAHIYSDGLFHRPQVILAAHVNLSGAAKVLSKLTGAKTLLNVYGLEIWSGLRRDAAWGLRTADHIIADCHFTARYLEDKGLRPKGSVNVIWDCVDLNRFFPAPPNKMVIEKYNIPDPSKGINLLTLGRMSRDAAYKGYVRLFEAFSRIANHVPDLRLIYAGRGQLVEDLRERAEALNLGHRVFFTGTIHEDDLPNVYRSAHIFSLVSDRGVGCGEGIPLTPLEAAACGLPILVGNQDGSQEAVLAGINGYLLDPFDIDLQAKVLTSLAINVDLRARMSRAACHHIENEFAFSKFLEKHRDLLASWFPDKFQRKLAQ